MQLYNHPPKCANDYEHWFLVQDLGNYECYYTSVFSLPFARNYRPTIKDKELLNEYREYFYYLYSRAKYKIVGLNLMKTHETSIAVEVSRAMLPRNWSKHLDYERMNFEFDLFSYNAPMTFEVYEFGELREIISEPQPIEDILLKIDDIIMAGYSVVRYDVVKSSAGILLQIEVEK